MKQIPMKEIDVENFRIYEHLLPYLINGDGSGLDDEELELAREVEEYVNGRIIQVPDEFEGMFAEPDHRGLWGSVVECNLVTLRGER